MVTVGTEVQVKLDSDRPEGYAPKAIEPSCKVACGEVGKVPPDVFGLFAACGPSLESSRLNMGVGISPSKYSKGMIGKYAEEA